MSLNYQPFITEKVLAERIKALGEQITKDYGKNEIFVIGVLKGSFIFTADLVRQIKAPVHIDFIQLTSYEGMHSSGKITIKANFSSQIENRHVLLVEDIVDSGLTIRFLMDHIQAKKPASLKICTLLSKPSQHDLSDHLDYVGFEVSKEFLIGYGLDFNGRFRELPYLARVL